MKKFVWSLVLGVIFLPQYAAADLTDTNRRVTVVLTDAVKFGGCMAQLDITLSTVGIGDCSSTVTFDCLGASGEVTKTTAQSNFSQAQLALVTQNRARFEVDPLVKINGVCLAKRVDVFRSVQ